MRAMIYHMRRRYRDRHKRATARQCDAQAGLRLRAAHEAFANDARPPFACSPPSLDSEMPFINAHAVMIMNVA